MTLNHLKLALSFEPPAAPQRLPHRFDPDNAALFSLHGGHCSESFRCVLLKSMNSALHPKQLARPMVSCLPCDECSRGRWMWEPLGPSPSCCAATSRHATSR